MQQRRHRQRVADDAWFPIRCLMKPAGTRPPRTARHMAADGLPAGAFQEAAAPAGKRKYIKHSGLEAPATRCRWRFIMRTQNHGLPVDCSDGIALFERKNELSQLACRGQSRGTNDILRGVLLDHETGRSAAIARRKAGATCQASLTTSPSNPLNHHTHPRGDQRVPGSPGTRCRHGNTSLAKWLT